jgi:hypothetical protein
MLLLATLTRRVRVRSATSCPRAEDFAADSVGPAKGSSDTDVGFGDDQVRPETCSISGKTWAD